MSHSTARPLRVPPPSTYTQIEGVGKDGTRTFRSSFKVSAAIPAVDKIGGSQVALVAMVYRVVHEEGQKINQRPGKFRNHKDAELVVVLKRRGGHYHR